MIPPDTRTELPLVGDEGTLLTGFLELIADPRGFTTITQTDLTSTDSHKAM